nr:MAG TPA: hypothetical protein [Caudoviricetes sp.]
MPILYLYNIQLLLMLYLKVEPLLQLLIFTLE